MKQALYLHATTPGFKVSVSLKRGKKSFVHEVPGYPRKRIKINEPLYPYTMGARYRNPFKILFFERDFEEAEP